MNPTPSATNINGFDPVYTKVSDFQFGESIAFTAPVQNTIDLAVNLNTPNRKIYAWLWTSATTNYAVNGVLTFYRGNAAAGTLPVSIANGTAITQSIASVCTTNGTNVQDCLGVYLTNPTGSQPASLILQPLYIYGIFDRITFSVPAAQGVTTLRAMLAVISSQ